MPRTKGKTTQTKIQTDLVGAKVYNGPLSDKLSNRDLSWYGMTEPATIRVVFWTDGGICLLIVDEAGKSAEVYPCQVTIK